MGKKVYFALAALFILFSGYILIFSGSDRYLLGPVCLLFLLIPPVAERMFRFRLGYPLRIAVLAFCFLGFSLGTALRWFDIYLGFDNMVHALSGILFTMIGLCFYAKASGSGDRLAKKILQISYAFFFSMAVAVVWEIGEFIGFFLTGHDSQHHLDTGVFDTMEDIMSCFLGSLVMALDYYLYTRSRKSPFMRIVLAFDRANGVSAE